MTEENRFINLETKISHQEHLLEELNQVIYRQQKQIDQLEKQVALLTQRLQEASEDSRLIGPANEKPPHY